MKVTRINSSVIRRRPEKEESARVIKFPEKAKREEILKLKTNLERRSG